jgi:hypothetical protein
MGNRLEAFPYRSADLFIDPPEQNFTTFPKNLTTFTKTGAARLAYLITEKFAKRWAAFFLAFVNQVKGYKYWTLDKPTYCFDQHRAKTIFEVVHPETTQIWVYGLVFFVWHKIIPWHRSVFWAFFR